MASRLRTRRASEGRREERDERKGSVLVSRWLRRVVERNAV